MRRIDWHNTLQIDPEFRQEYGVVFACPFKERGGATVRDYSGNRLDGTLAASTAAPSRTLDKWGGPALSFDGSDDYLDVVHPYLTRWTLGCWVKVTLNGGYHTIAIRGSSGISSRNFGLGIAPTGSLYSMSTDGGSYYGSATTSLAVSGVWCFCVGSYDGITFRTYLNALADGTQTATMTPNDNGGPLRFGTYNGAPLVDYLQGQVALAFTCNKAITAEQVARLYRDPYAMYWQPSTTTYFLPQTPSPPTSYATYLTLLGVG